ncbi:MFS transporter [Glycomyces endophyticus]|uniref:MFS transporter n=1 Tax=Glycomyces endophyticus TaxID=480996 RepID=A0ABN2FTG1_9ACTN
MADLAAGARRWLGELVPPRGPVRRFAVATLCKSAGAGLFMVAGALYFTRIVDLGAAQVGLGIAAGSLLAMALMIPAGRAADRLGGKPSYTAVLGLAAAAMLAFAFVDGFGAYLAVMAVYLVADKALGGITGLVVHGLGLDGGTDRVLIRSYLRAAGNTGISLGSLAAGVVLFVDTAAAYRIMIAATAVLLATAAVLAASVPVPRTASEPVRRSPRRVLRDRVYLLVTATTGVTSLQYHVLAFAIPLWVAQWTEAPLWTASVVLIVNTLIVIGLQVRVGARVRTVPEAGDAARTAGVLLAAGCLVVMASAAVPALAAVAVLLVWTVVHSVAEMLHAASDFCLSFELAPDDAQGEYQAAFALGDSLAHAAGPALLAVTVLAHPYWAWPALGALLLASTLATRAIAARSAAPAVTAAA